MSRPKSKLLVPVRSFWRLIRALFAANENLSAEESASTLFRFFRSSHVMDLRLIAAFALSASAIHFMIVLAFERIHPVSAFWEQFKSYAALAVLIYVAILGLAYLGAERRRDVVDAASVTGVAVLALAVYALITVLVVEIPGASKLPHGLITYFAPVLPIYAAVIAWTYLTAATRLGVVDLFACEMRTVCRVGTAFDIGVAYIALRQQCLDKINAGRGDVPLEERTKSSADSKGFVSQENYFPVFEGNAHDLEALEATVVGFITEFYTYMKVARDLLRKVGDEPAKSAQALYVSLVYVIFLGYESARKAIKELIEFEPTKAENMMMILLTELECYTFLCNHYQDDLLRFERFAFRFDEYKDDLAYVSGKIMHYDANDRNWGPARRTLEPLMDRFNTMKRTVEPLMARKHRAVPQDNKPAEPVPGEVAA
jgi:hypothetical protein